MITKGISVAQLRLDKPVIYLRRYGDTWSISEARQEGAAGSRPSGPERPIAIERHRRQRRNGRDRRSRRGAADARAVAVRASRRQSWRLSTSRFATRSTSPTCRSAARTRDLALNSLSGGVAVRNDTLYLDRIAVRTSESAVAVDGAIQNYLSTPVFQLKVASEKLSMPELAPVLPALEGPATDARVYARARRPAQPSQGRAPRALVGGRGVGEARRRCGRTGAVGPGRRGGAAPRSRPDPRRQIAEERPHRDRENRPAGAGAVAVQPALGIGDVLGAARGHRRHRRRRRQRLGEAGPRHHDHRHPRGHVRRGRDGRRAAGSAGERPAGRLRHARPGPRPGPPEAAADAEGARRRRPVSAPITTPSAVAADPSTSRPTCSIR